MKLKEATANKVMDFSVVNNALYPTVAAVKNYTDATALTYAIIFGTD